MAADLLIELFTEELPPKALSRLSESFSRTVFDELIERGLARNDAQLERFASPRRLALRILP